MAVDQPLPPARGREAGECQPEPKARGSLSPRDGILHQIVSWIPVANQVFLGSCMVDICQEGCSQRSAPQRRCTGLLRLHPAARTSAGEVIRHTAPPGECALTKHLVA